MRKRIIVKQSENGLTIKIRNDLDSVHTLEGLIKQLEYIYENNIFEKESK